MLTGQTHFLGMGFEQPAACSSTSRPTRPRGLSSRVPRPQDRIIAIALADQSGWERIITGYDLSEPEMLPS
jgi:hypothetical protein